MSVTSLLLAVTPMLAASTSLVITSASNLILDEKQDLLFDNGIREEYMLPLPGCIFPIL